MRAEAGSRPIFDVDLVGELGDALGGAHVVAGGVQVAAVDAEAEALRPAAVFSISSAVSSKSRPSSCGDPAVFS